MNYIENPLDQKPVHIHDYWIKSWGLYKPLNELNEQLSEYKQLYQDGTGWKQNYENVLKLYQSLNFLNQQGIKDTTLRLQAIQSLKQYYEIVHNINETKNINRLLLLGLYDKAIAYIDQSNNSSWNHPPFTDTENIEQKLNELLVFKEVHDCIFAKPTNIQTLYNLLEKTSQLSSESLKKKLEEPLRFYSTIMNLNTIKSRISFFNQEIEKTIEFENDFNWKNDRHTKLNQLEKEINQNCISQIWENHDHCIRFPPLSKACQQVKEYLYLSGRPEINEPITHKIINILNQLKKSGIDISNRDKGYQIAKTFFLVVHSADQLLHSSNVSNEKIANTYLKANQLLLQTNQFFKNEGKRVVDSYQTSQKADAFKIMNAIDVYINSKKQIPDKQSLKTFNLQMNNQYIHEKYKNFLKLLNLYYRCIEQGSQPIAPDTFDPRLHFIHSHLWNHTIGEQLLKNKYQKPMISSIEKDVKEIKKQLKIFINEPDAKMSASCFIELVQRINKNYQKYFEEKELLFLQTIVTTLKKISYDNNIILCQQFESIQQLPTKALRQRFSNNRYEKYVLYIDQLSKLRQFFDNYREPQDNIQRLSIINYCEGLALKEIDEFGKQYDCTLHKNYFSKLKKLYHKTVMKKAYETFQKKHFRETITFLQKRLSKGMYQLLQTDAQYEDFYLGVDNLIKLSKALVNEKFDNIQSLYSPDDIYYHLERKVIKELMKK